MTSPEMPGRGQRPAAAATVPDLDVFPSLSDVRTNGVPVVRAERAGPLAGARTWALLGNNRPRGEVRAAAPWSLPLSAAEHALVGIVDSRREDARPTGIGALTLGDMLPVSAGQAT